MELRKVDPRSLKENPDNPRKIPASEEDNLRLIASIQTIGLLQPPVVRQKGDDLEITAGSRRVQATIRLDWQTIEVLVLDEDDGCDSLRSLSENIVRTEMNIIDRWRAIEALTSANYTENAISVALATPTRTIKQYRLFNNIHPPILEQFAAGDMPEENELQIIAAASKKEQAEIWNKHKPKNGQTPNWEWIANALRKTKLYASVAKFGTTEEQSFGIIWQEDLFTQGDEDSRYTTQVAAFLAAQQAWMEANLPKKGVVLTLDDHGYPKLPPKSDRVYGKPKKSDITGQYVDRRNGQISEIVFRPSKPEPGKGKAGSAYTETDDVAPVARTRADVTQKGMDIIGELRTEALGKALLENPIDDVTLIGLLVLGFSASNVSIRTGGYSSAHLTPIVQRVTEGGRLTQDLDILRQAARETLASFLSSRPGMNDSGIVARFAGDVIGADGHLPNMATEEFLSCLSKTAIEKAAASLSVLPRQRAKETRAALIEQVGKGTFVLPAALFAPTESELAKHHKPPNRYHYGDDANDAADEPATTNDAGEDDPQHDAADAAGAETEFSSDAAEDNSFGDHDPNAGKNNDDDQDEPDMPSSPPTAANETADTEDTEDFGAPIANPDEGIEENANHGHAVTHRAKGRSKKNKSADQHLSAA